MASNNVIIFGATGGVGSAAARTAQQHGAKVFLAMRDTQKSIPGLTPEQEKEGGFERVQADFTQPEAVSAAVKKTGAKKAFIYLIFGAADGMRSSIEALKSAGIELVVFLSSDGLANDEPKSIPPSSFISWAHAQVELALQETFGTDGYIAVRPAYFASNTTRWKKEIALGDVKIVHPGAKFDWISPNDIGAVAGNVLVKGLQAVDGPKKNVIRLWGPELISLRDAVGVIAKGIGKDIKVTEVSEGEGLESLKSDGLPQPVAQQLIDIFRKRGLEDADDELYTSQVLKVASDNVRKYGEKEPETLQEWVAKNKHQLGA